MDTPKRRSLAEFGANRPARRVCWTCQLPEADEMAKAHRVLGISVPAIVEWLREECGYAEIPSYSVEHHFHLRHDINRQ